VKQKLLQQPFYGSLDFVRDNPGELVPEETFTHSHISWSSITKQSTTKYSRTAQHSIQWHSTVCYYN